MLLVADGVSNNAHAREFPWLPLPKLDWSKTIDPLSDSFVVLFTNHALQPIFNPRSLPLAPGATTRSSIRPNHRIFFWLLAESSWRFTVEALEDRMQLLRKEATLVAGHQAFESPTTLRRRLADAQGLLADTRSEFDASINTRDIAWDVDRTKLSAEEFWLEKRDEPVAVNLRKAETCTVC
jgi:hypothetical protein